jgi:hypothetical protein
LNFKKRKQESKGKEQRNKSIEKRRRAKRMYRAIQSFSIVLRRLWGKLFGEENKNKREFFF